MAHAPCPRAARASIAPPPSVPPSTLLPVPDAATVSGLGPSCGLGSGRRLRSRTRSRTRNANLCASAPPHRRLTQVSEVPLLSLRRPDRLPREGADPVPGRLPARSPGNPGPRAATRPSARRWDVANWWLRPAARQPRLRRSCGEPHPCRAPRPGQRAGPPLRRRDIATWRLRPAAGRPRLRRSCGGPHPCRAPRPGQRCPPALPAQPCPAG
jgi:hypothetical protein